MTAILFNIDEAASIHRRRTLRINGARAMALILCAVWCLMQSGCAHPKNELLRRLPTIFTEKQAKTGVAPYGPDELLAVLGKPDSRKSVGGATEDWLYRYSDGAVKLRLNFFNPGSRPGENQPASKAALTELTVYDENGRIKAVPFGPAAWDG